jgi:Zn-dependent protease with chaperone function
MGSFFASPLEPTFWLAVPLIGLAMYLSASGALLNQEFRDRLERHLAGTGDPGPLRVGRLTTWYGLNLVLLVCLGYVLLLLSLMLVYDLLFLVLIVTAFVPLLATVLVPAGVLVAVASAWGVVRGVLGLGRPRSEDVPVSSEQEPALWELSREVAAAVGTRPADRLVLSPFPGISVHEEGGLPRLAVGSTERILTLGMPSVVGLSVQETRSILAHEYGHFSDRDTAWTALTYRAGAAVADTLAELKGVGGTLTPMELLVWFNPARWVLSLYMRLYAYVTSGFSRMREVFADQTAIRLYGAPAFVDGLRQVVANDTLFHSVCVPRMLNMAREDGALKDLYAELEHARCTAPASAVAEIHYHTRAERWARYDSHPPIGQRIAYAERLASAQPIAPQDERQLAELFSSWRRRATQLSELANARLFGAIRDW